MTQPDDARREDDSDAPVRWRLRRDLRFEPAGSAGRYQVRNPASDERFELGEEEVFLCRALAEASGAEDIRAAFARRFGLAITVERLDRFYRDMAALGLLEPASDEPLVETDVDPLDADDDDRASGVYRWVSLDSRQGFAWLAERLGWLRH